MKLRAVIFDLDGTLANTLPVCFHAIRTALREFTGRTYADAEILDLFGPSEKGICQRLAPDRWEECYRMVVHQYEKAHYLCTGAAPGIIEMLEMLKSKGVKLGIITGKGRSTADISLRYTGLTPYFDAIETGSVKGVVKAAAITEMLAKWGIPRDDAAYVGDSTYDMESAKEAGVLPIGVTWLDTMEPGELTAAGAEIIFGSVADFAKWCGEQTA
jgi:pyrophosphatase PpaX